MAYCKQGEKAQVFYTFKDGIKGTASLDKCPFEVVTGQDRDTIVGGQQDGAVYTINGSIIWRYREAQFRFPAYPALGDYKEFTETINPLSAPTVWGPVLALYPGVVNYGELIIGDERGDRGIFINCRGPYNIGNQFYPPQNQYLYFRGLGGIFQVNETTPISYTLTLSGGPSNDKDKRYEGRCFIQVKYNGQVIFSDRGDCPINFSVECDDCPEGTIRCESPGYPGYCCLPCNEIKSEIQSLTHLVRSINNG